MSSNVSNSNASLDTVMDTATTSRAALESAAQTTVVALAVCVGLALLAGGVLLLYVFRQRAARARVAAAAARLSRARPPAAEAQPVGRAPTPLELRAAVNATSAHLHRDDAALRQANGADPLNRWIIGGLQGDQGLKTEPSQSTTISSLEEELSRRRHDRDEMTRRSRGHTPASHRGAAAASGTGSAGMGTPTQAAAYAQSLATGRSGRNASCASATGLSGGRGNSTPGPDPGTPGTSAYRAVDVGGGSTPSTASELSGRLRRRPVGMSSLGASSGSEITASGTAGTAANATDTMRQEVEWPAYTTDTIRQEVESRWPTYTGSSARQRAGSWGATGTPRPSNTPSTMESSTARMPHSCSSQRGKISPTNTQSPQDAAMRARLQPIIAVRVIPPTPSAASASSFLEWPLPGGVRVAGGAAPAGQGDRDAGSTPAGLNAGKYPGANSAHQEYPGGNSAHVRTTIPAGVSQAASGTTCTAGATATAAPASTASDIQAAGGLRDAVSAGVPPVQSGPGVCVGHVAGDTRWQATDPRGPTGGKTGSGSSANGGIRSTRDAYEHLQVAAGSSSSLPEAHCQWQAGTTALPAIERPLSQDTRAGGWAQAPTASGSAAGSGSLNPAQTYSSSPCGAAAAQRPSPRTARRLGLRYPSPADLGGPGSRHGSPRTGFEKETHWQPTSQPVSPGSIEALACLPANLPLSGAALAASCTVTGGEPGTEPAPMPLAVARGRTASPGPKLTSAGGSLSSRTNQERAASAGPTAGGAMRLPLAMPQVRADTPPLHPRRSSSSSTATFCI